MKKKNNNPFKDMNNAAVGMAGLGVTGAVVAGVSAQAPAGSPNMNAGFNSLVGFTPIMGTMVGGSSVLKMLPKSKKKW